MDINCIEEAIFSIAIGQRDVLRRIELPDLTRHWLETKVSISAIIEGRELMIVRIIHLPFLLFVCFLLYTFLTQTLEEGNTFSGCIRSIEYILYVIRKREEN